MIYSLTNSDECDVCEEADECEQLCCPFTDEDRNDYDRYFTSSPGEDDYVAVQDSSHTYSRVHDGYDMENTPRGKWEFRPGSYVQISEMTTVHIKNCMKLILRLTSKDLSNMQCGKDSQFHSPKVKPLGFRTQKYMEFLSELQLRTQSMSDFELITGYKRLSANNKKIVNQIIRGTNGEG